MTVDMDHVMESSLVLEMSTTVSGISTQQTSIVDIQYDPTSKIGYAQDTGKMRLYGGGQRAEEDVLIEHDEDDESR